MIDTSQVQVGYTNCYENQVTSSEDSDVMGDNVLYSEFVDIYTLPPYYCIIFEISLVLNFHTIQLLSSPLQV